MSSSYAGNGDTYPATITLPDDGDPRSAASVSTPLEGLADRSAWARKQMTRQRLISLGEQAFASSDDHFALDLNFMSLSTHTAVGDQAKIGLNRALVHGAALTGVTLIFVPKNTHAGLPATTPAVSLVRWSVVPGDAPALVEVIATASYSPVDLTDYNNGEFKHVEATFAEHTVNVEEFVYQLVIADESGSNAIVGNSYVAARLTYAS